MRIQFTGDAFIHSDIHDLTVKHIGALFKGVVIEVEDEMLEGALFKGNNKWYKIKNEEFYFWSGRAKIIDKAPSFDIKWSTLTFDKNKMNWAIKDLDILEKFWKEWNLTGAGVKVAILDSGIDITNPDLKIAIKQVKNFIPGGLANDVMDTVGHGTKCAGLIGGRGFQKVFGIAPECDLYIAKIGNRESMPTLDRFSEALDWAKKMKVDIISMSVTLLEGAFDNDPNKKKQFQQKIDDLHDAGILLVGSTGNNNISSDVMQYPAYFTNCLSIGAVKKDGEMHNMSGKSKQLNLVAPGDDLLTTGLQSTIAKFGQTSAAAAVCSGILALLKQYINQSDNPTLPVSDLVQMLTRSAVYKGLSRNKCKDLHFGCGTINPVGVKEEIDLQVIS